MRRSVSAIMIVFQHNFPHILLFKVRKKKTRPRRQPKPIFPLCTHRTCLTLALAHRAYLRNALSIVHSQGPQESRYWLPGGRLRVGEGESEGLKRKLDKLMKPEDEELKFEWEIVDLAMTLWRPTHSKVSTVPA